MVDCAQCGRNLPPTQPDQPVAVISVEVMGDEYTESYFYCEACGVYTQETHRDRFLGEDSVSYSGPIDRQVGDAIVATIRECADPTNKKCTCPTHRKFL